MICIVLLNVQTFYMCMYMNTRTCTCICYCTCVQSVCTFVIVGKLAHSSLALCTVSMLTDQYCHISLYRWMGLNDRSLDALGRHEFKVTGPREYHGSNLTRIATLEARASKRANLGVLVFLPFMFFIFAFMLGRCR